MKRTTIYLDSELESRLKQEVSRLGVPMAHYIREAITDRLEKGRLVRSPFAGVFRSGRGDLSERAEELLDEGFGT